MQQIYSSLVFITSNVILYYEKNNTFDFPIGCDDKRI